jgi:hypothetical protein
LRKKAGLPDGIFQTKNPNLGKFWRVLQWKALVYFLAIWSTLRSVGIFVAIWYILWSFGTFFPLWYLNREKSGNPARESQQKTEKMFSFRET